MCRLLGTRTTKRKLAQDQILDDMLQIRTRTRSAPKRGLEIRPPHRSKIEVDVEVVGPLLVLLPSRSRLPSNHGLLYPTQCPRIGSLVPRT
jgi:hypothetical protein